jgi:hypothetical protein
MFPFNTQQSSLNLEEKSSHTQYFLLGHLLLMLTLPLKYAPSSMEILGSRCRL